jgi:hypothetical protein
MSYRRYLDSARPDLSNLEPHPDPANHSKYLKGDGTYDTPSGSGSSTLAGLTDVQLAAPADGEMLKYDGASGKWVNSNHIRGGSF